MNRYSTQALLRDGIQILRTKGVASAFRAGLRVANVNYQGYWWYLQYLYRKHTCQDCQTTEPFSVVNVDPANITRSVAPEIDRWDDLGAVLDGDWDLTEYTVSEHSKYRSVVDHVLVTANENKYNYAKDIVLKL